MKFKITVICLFLSMLIVSLSYAEGIYYWKDKKGVTVISTTPPPDNVNDYETYGLQKDSPEEIERYNRERDQKRIAEENRSASIRRANESKSAAERIKKENNESDDQLKKMVELEKNRLKEKRDKCNSFSGKLPYECRKKIDKSIALLERDPDQYFYNKENQGEIGLGINPETGRVGPVIPLK